MLVDFVSRRNYINNFDERLMEEVVNSTITNDDGFDKEFLVKLR